MGLHASGEDYLEAILVLQKKKGLVRSADVARHLEVSKPSVCHAVATLKKGGFLLMDGDHFLHLTDLGREVAEDTYEKHRFFTEMLVTAGVDPVTAERDACRIEHVISKETFERLKAARKLSEKAVIWALHVISAIFETGIVSAMASGLEIGRGHHLLFHLAQRCIPHEVACHWWCAPFSKAKKRRSLISKTPAPEYYMIGSWL